MEGFLESDIEFPKDGIPLDRISSDFDKKTLENKICSICLNLVWNPIDCSKCQNIFCKYCIDIIKKEKKYSCPLCRKLFKSSNCKALKKIFEGIKIKCANSSCKEYPNYSDYVEHLKNCQYRKYHCSNEGCDYENTLNNKEELKTHFTSCLYRITNCDFCKKEMIANELKNHCIKDCPKFIIECEYCNQSMTREYFNREHTDKKCMKFQIKRLNNNINNLINKAKENEKENKEKFSILEKYTLDLKEMIIELKNEKSGMGMNPKMGNPMSGIGMNPMAGSSMSGMEIGMNPMIENSLSGIGMNLIKENPMIGKDGTVTPKILQDSITVHT